MTDTLWNTRADGWQPIETAPKDGTRFLGAGHRGSEPDIIEWGNGRWLGKRAGYNQTWVTRPGWEVSPTHWQPLPAFQIGGAA